MATILPPVASLAQPDYTNGNIKDIKKWVLATVPIEVRQSNNKALIRHTDTMRLKQGPEGKKRMLDIRDSIRVLQTGGHGTAIFYKVGDQYYLISARHMIIDTTSDQENWPYYKMILIDDPSAYYSFRGVSPYLSLLRAENVLVSNVDDDIGLIKLGSMREGGTRFVETLLKRGYVPVTPDDIDTNLIVGEKITAIGYPQESLLMIRNDLNKAWNSNLLVLPVVTNGIIVNPWYLHNFFEGNIFVYYGNSGGPIISNDKLIGIVSGSFAEDVKLTTTPPHYFRVPHAKFTKIKLLFTLLDGTYRN